MVSDCKEQEEYINRLEKVIENQNDRIDRINKSQNSAAISFIVFAFIFAAFGIGMCYVKTMMF